MEPKNWGKFGWGFIHNVALGYSEDLTYMKKEQYRKFFEAIGDVLPCLDCQTHYKDMLVNIPPVLVNKDTLFKWTVDIHNKVNERLNKKIVSYDEAYNIWTKSDIIKPIKKTENKLYYLSLIFFLILLVCVLIILYFQTS
jgi:mitochondrial FAD-linked sulfhydryl oxidase